MPTPASKGNTDFRDVSIAFNQSIEGYTRTVTRRGAASALDAELNKYKVNGKSGSGFYLESISSSEKGPVAEVVLTYRRSLETNANQKNVTTVTDDITEESVTLTTSTGENVNFRYFSQTTNYTYIADGPTPPKGPRHSAVVASSIPIGFLRQPNPPNYTGSIQGAYKSEGVLVSFSRQRLADGSWQVSESFKNLIEPVSQNENP